MGCCESKETPPEGMQMDNKPVPRISVQCVSEQEESVMFEEDSYESE